MDAAGRTRLEAAIGYSFREPLWLTRALTHSSRRHELGADEAAEDNERLEFLGDAVLGLVSSEYLVATYPGWSVGELNRAKERMVSGRSLHTAAVRLDLGSFLDLGRGEEKTGGREKRTLLADAYEAILAAIYLDGGYAAAQGFLRRSLIDPAVEELGPELSEPDPKAALRDRLLALGPGDAGEGSPAVPVAAEYRVVSESGPDHRKSFTVEVRFCNEVLGVAEGTSKKEAEAAAARRALERLAAGESVKGN